MGKHPAGIGGHGDVDLSNMFEDGEGFGAAMPDLSAMFGPLGIAVPKKAPAPPGMGNSPPAAGHRSKKTGKKSPLEPGRDPRKYTASNKYKWTVGGLSTSEVGKIIT
eukprot:Hpha_TRINITY_DN14980_c1_g4::TRINITY_DN14980_c1_g4_i1::g.142867::m.142867